MNTSPVPPAENAPLYLLDGLDAGELDAYMLARLRDPVVQAAECEAADTLADLALSVPQIAPPEATLAAIQARIQATSRPLPVRFFRRVLSISPGWAAAAVLAVVAGWNFMQRSAAEEQLAQLRLKQEKQEKLLASLPGGPAALENPDKFVAGVTVPVGSVSPDSPGGKNGRTAASPRTGGHRLIQDIPALQARLELLEKRNARRFESVPGLHRPVIFEMQDPNQARPGDGSKLTLSSGRVGDILADALLSGNDPDKTTPGAADKPPFKIGVSNRDDEILIESGMRDLSVFHLPEEVHVRNLGLPVDQAADNGLQPMPDGTFYEAKSHLIWRPAADGRGYIGTRPTAEFTPPPSGSDTAAPPATPPPAADTTAARAFPIFDESTGQGSIILQNLPDPGPGMTWQLWFTDPELPAPFSPGILPHMETGSGRVFFDLGRTGYAPAGCYLTREPAAGSAQPTGTVILKGP